MPSRNVEKITVYDSLKEEGRKGRFLGLTPIGLKVRDFSRLSELNNSLQGFSLKGILF